MALQHNRRELLNGLYLSAAAALAMGFWPKAMAITKVNSKAFHPPESPSVLTRRLTRFLSDGEAISVTRSWQVQFRKLADGYVLEGKQIVCDVSAPQSLKYMAQLEQRRIEEGFLPLYLNTNGQIVSESVTKANSHSDPLAQMIERRPMVANDQQSPQAANMFNRAYDQTLGSMGLADMNEADRQFAQEFLKQLKSGKPLAFTKLPSDLFFPAEPATNREFTLPGPDGSDGSILLERSSEMNQSGTIFHKATRKVTTRIANDTALSEEQWKLEPLGALGKVVKVVESG